MAIGYAMIARDFKAFTEARAYLASNGTTVKGRKEALAVRDDFKFSAPNFVGELLDLLEALRSSTDGEECADPDTCRGQWMCSRCRIRVIVPELGEGL